MQFSCTARQFKQTVKKLSYSIYSVLISLGLHEICLQSRLSAFS